MIRIVDFSTLSRVKPIPPAQGVDPGTPGVRPTPFIVTEEDSVEISDAARKLAEGSSFSPERQSKIDHIRSQIADGSYETKLRIEGTLDRLMSVLADS